MSTCLCCESFLLLRAFDVQIKKNICKKKESSSYLKPKQTLEAKKAVEVH
jgi:hypothetical protein